jgi:hypothetical protein
MGKRDPDKFEKKPRDAYFTIDPAAVNVLQPHLNLWWPSFVEPCAGGGDLARALVDRKMQCEAMFDIEPQAIGVIQRNCLTLNECDVDLADQFITNPPFTWKVLQPIMDHLISLLPTWLLLPADYMHNVRMGPYMKQCEKVVSIGRLYWEENKVKGVDNYCWYHFNRDHEGKTEFVGR